MSWQLSHCSDWELYCRGTRDSITERGRVLSVFFTAYTPTLPPPFPHLIRRGTKFPSPTYQGLRHEGCWAAIARNHISQCWLYGAQCCCAHCTVSRAECYLGSRGLHRTPCLRQPARSHGRQQTFKLAAVTTLGSTEWGVSFTLRRLYLGPNGWDVGGSHRLQSKRSCNGDKRIHTHARIRILSAIRLHLPHTMDLPIM